jgi:hypothetical protein
MMKRSWGKDFKRLISSFRSKLNRKAAKRYLFLGIFVTIYSLSLPFLDYFHQKTTESYPSEIVLLSIFYVIIGLILLATYSLWLKTKGERLFATLVTTYLFTEHWSNIIKDFSWLRNLIGSSISAIIIPVILYLTVGLLAIGLRKIEVKIEEKKWSEHPFETIAKFACVVILVLNSYALGAYLQKRHAVDSYKQPATVGDLSSLDNPKGPARDIYYFVFDRYASPDSMKSNFNFDNSEYLNNLKNSGFVVRNNAFSNYQFTAPSVASTVRMDYHTDISKKLSGAQPDDYLPYKQLIQNSQAASLLKKAGYKTYNVGNWWDLSRKENGAVNVLPEFTATILGKNFILTELQSQVIDKSFLGGFLRHGLPGGLLKVTHGGPAEIYLHQLSDVKNIAQGSKDQPKFVFGHFLNAHPPYVFNSDGNAAPYNKDDNNTGVPRSVKYVNMVKFANSSTEDLIKTIQANSKVPPIIIIQADEGPYPLNAPSQWQNASSATLKLKFGTLAAYALPGLQAEDATKIDSSVNIFRFIFNNYFGSNYNYLPDCSYVFNPGGKPFVYYDVTSKLHKTNTDCEKYK